MKDVRTRMSFGSMTTIVGASKRVKEIVLYVLHESVAMAMVVVLFSGWARKDKRYDRILAKKRAT